MRLSELDSYVPKPMFKLKERNIIYCPVYKAASSTWIDVLLQLSKSEKSERKTSENHLSKDLIEEAKI